MNIQLNDYPLDEQELIEKIRQHFLLKTPTDADDFICEFETVLRQAGIKILSEEIVPESDSSLWLKQAKTAMDEAITKLKPGIPFTMPKEPIKPASLALRIQLKTGDIAAKLFGKELGKQVSQKVLGTQVKAPNKKDQTL